MSTQELLTFLFNAIALGFVLVAVTDFSTRSVAAYKQISNTSNSSLTTIKPTNQSPVATNPQKLPQLPDPWLLPLPVQKAVGLVNSDLAPSSNSSTTNVFAHLPLG